MSDVKATPHVSVIIPSWTGEVSRVLASLEQQSFRDYEVKVVGGLSPAARARNVGVEQTSGAILVFIDDDAYFGSADTLEKLVKAVESDPTIGVVGSSKILPPDASTFQKAVANQVPRMIYPVVEQDTESNPPLGSYGYTAITTTCCAMRRELYTEFGGLDETLPTSEDTDFFYQVRRKGYRILVVGNCWVYHDPPTSLKALLRKSYRYGQSHAYEANKSPQRAMNVLPFNRWYGWLVMLGLLLAFPLALFVHYYFDPTRHIVLGFRPWKTLSTYSVLLGYFSGWQEVKRTATKSSVMA